MYRTRQILQVRNCNLQRRSSQLWRSDTTVQAAGEKLAQRSFRVRHLHRPGGEDVDTESREGRVSETNQAVSQLQTVRGQQDELQQGASCGG